MIEFWQTRSFVWTSDSIQNGWDNLKVLSHYAVDDIARVGHALLDIDVEEPSEEVQEETSKVDVKYGQFHFE